MPPVLPASLIARWLLLLVLLAGAYFLSDFLVPALAALVIGLATWPVYRRILGFCNGNTTAGAIVSLLLVLAVLVVPLSLASIYAFREASSVFAWMLATNRNGAAVPAWMPAIPMVGEKLAACWNSYLGEPHALGDLVQLVSGEHIGNIYRMVLGFAGNAARLILALLFMLLILFFLYKDGRQILAQVDLLGERILPSRWQRFSRMVPATIAATVTGMGLIALGEGVVLGVAYWIAGVPAHVLLAVITGLMALVPGGAPTAFTLVSLYLIGSNHVGAGIGLLAWGAIELFIVDKTLRPRLVGGPVKLPFLPTFFGLVGGVKTLGIVGLFVGPVLMALLVSVWREWVRTVKEEREAEQAKAGSRP